MTNSNKLNKSTIIQLIILIITPVLIALIPCNDIFTQPIKIFAMITITGILTLAFELFDYGLAAMFIPSLYAISGIVPTATAFSGYATNIPWIVLGALLLTEILDDTGVLKRISYWCILKCGGTFKGTVWGIFLAGLILTVLTSGQANFVFAPFCYGICKALNLGKSKESAIIMFAGCISTISTTPLVYKPAFMGLALGGAQTIIPDISVSWLGYLWHNLPNLFFCTVLIFASMFVFRPNFDCADGKEYFKEQYASLGNINSLEKKTFALLAILFIYVLTANWHGLAMEWGFVLIPWLGLLPGMNLGDHRTVRKVNFSMILFIGSCLCIGSVSAALGVGTLVSQIISPILQGLSSVGVIAVVWCSGFLLNFVLTPLAACGALSAPLTQIAIDLGLNPLVAIYTLIGSMDQLLFPYEYASYAIFFAFGMCTMKDFVKFMSVKTIVHFIFMMLIMVPWWKFVGLL